MCIFHSTCPYLHGVAAVMYLKFIKSEICMSVRMSSLIRNLLREKQRKKRENINSSVAVSSNKKIRVMRL